MPETNGAAAGIRKPQQEPAGQKSPTEEQEDRPAVQEKDQQPQQQEPVEQKSPRGGVLNGRAVEDQAFPQQEPAEQKSATGASLPALLLSTAQAVVLSASHSFPSALPLAAHAFRGPFAFSAQQPLKEDSDAERQFLDTARGPAGDYRNAQRVGQGNGVLPAGIKPHVWVSFLTFMCAHSGLHGGYEHTESPAVIPALPVQHMWQWGEGMPNGYTGSLRMRVYAAACLQDAARMLAESQAACKEVWAPGYDHTPELSDSEEQTGVDAIDNPAMAFLHSFQR